MRVSDTEAAQRVADNDNLVGELVEALTNLVSTAEYLWDKHKPIKDGPGIRITHPVIEEAKAALAKAQGAQQ